MTRHPLLAALILLMFAGGVYAATQILSSPTADVAERAHIETPREIAGRIAASFRRYSLAHEVAPLAALYAPDSVRYLDLGLLTRDSILAELRRDYGALARTDSFEVTLDTVSIDTARATGPAAIDLRWHTSYARVRVDSSRFSGSTRDELRLVRRGDTWSIVRHERRLLAGVAPDGVLPRRVTGTPSRSTGAGSTRRSGGTRVTRHPAPVPRRPIISVRIDRGIEVDFGKPGKGSKAKKRRK